MNIEQKQYIYGIITIIIASILWGTTGTAATFAPQVNAFAIGAAAMGGGGILQACLSYRLIIRSADILRKEYHFLIIGSLAVVIYPLAFYQSMNLAGVAIGNVISIGCAPIVSAIIEMIADGLKVTLNWIIGAVFGISGVILLCATQNHHYTITSTDSSSLIAGIIYGLVAALTYSLYSWAAHKLIQKSIPSRAVMGTIFGIGGLLLMPILFITGKAFLYSLNNFSVGLYMALIPMFLGYICFGFGLKRVKASIATTITLLEPVVATILAIAFLGEKLSFYGWCGIMMIVFCLIFTTLPQKKL